MHQLLRRELGRPTKMPGRCIFSHSRWPIIHIFRGRELGLPTQRLGKYIYSHSRLPVIHPGRLWRQFTALDVCGCIWEDGTVPAVTATSLNNLNVISANEVKTMYRKIDINKKRKIRHGQINQLFKILILFIK